MRLADAKPALREPGVEADFELTFYPENPIAPGGGILIVYPSQTLLTEAGTLSAEVKIDGLAVDQEKLVQSYDLSARAVRITNIV